MALNLGKLIFEFLKENSNQKFTARQIAEWIFATYPVECQAKKFNSQNLDTDAKLIQQIVAEISAYYPRIQKKNPELKATEGRPRKYYYSDKSDSAEVVDAESTSVISSKDKVESKLGEHTLYGLLSRYLWEEFGVHSKRVDEKRSSNKRGPNGNRWLYPDVVGMEDLGTEWHQEVRDCVDQRSDKRTRLWSFEAKLLINRSNARECFFQAVSNSSWANFGYLVAAEIEGHDTLKELRMLFAAHGIGLIKLDVENPAESQVLIPALEREEIDWDMANRLATENKDFLEYVKLVKRFYQTGDVRGMDWDASEIAE
ncbi:COG2958 family protein [Burkholderia stagnalis]|uniref:COG2958 family protein n=1 Tax=Burkholderia stagnalis TaxID=1503054 RepID=UPI0008417B5E|nr:HrgA protein [Burkholderia stagnalis]AOK51258.1 HrgA protein [Burkholderia stagnalis]